MGEKEPKKEPLIPRETPRIVIKSLGNLALTYVNTRLYEFPAPWQDMNHAFVQRGQNADGQVGQYFFRREFAQLYEQLDENGYPKNREAFPADGDVKAYEAMQSRILGKELEALENGNNYL